jgi:hypothetical protein
MKFRRTVLSVSITAAIATLSACGGGGGGGGGGSTQTYINRQVPYYTPQRVGSVTPINSSAYEYDSSALFSQNLSGNGEELITAGRSGSQNQGSYPTYNLNIFGWSGNTLVNQTSQWFSGTDNVILGTEPSVKFADFDGDGRKDMYVSSYADNSLVGSSWVFFNNGNNFTRQDLNLGVHGHDSAVYDLNADGYFDIFTAGSRVSFGSANRSFSTHVVSGSHGGTVGSVAIADFMGNGTSSIILTDQNAWQSGNNRLYSWSMTDGALNGRPGTQDFSLALISTLPDSRFLLPKWSSQNFLGSHDYRVLAFDFDNSGLSSAVVFSRPVKSDGNGGHIWPEFNEIQFLKNSGGGTFIDVTDTVLVGYNTATSASTYNPKIMDVNSDGLLDIVLSGTSWTTGTGAQVLIHTQEHKYVASYAAVIDAFVAQSTALEKAINTSATSGANGIVFVRGPDGAMYLATAVSYTSSGVQQKAIYLSKLGNGASNAQATAAAIKQQWPWMSDAQVNTVLAQSSTTWFGLNVLDPAKALSPIGALSLPVNGRLMDLSGYIGGINLNGVANRVNVVDSVGRNFTMNYSATNTPGIMNLWSRFVENIDDDTRGAQVSGVQTFRYNGFKFGGTEDNRNMVVGVTGIEVYKDTSLSVQYTRMPFSPFVQLAGAWGLVKSSSTMESTITNRQGGFVNKLGLMYSSTEIDSGLVNRVNPISSVWAESGYEWKHFRAYAGMLPKVISGTADINLPTGIDNRGQIQYTSTRAEVYGPTVHYARFNYTDRINRYANYRINAMVTTQKQHTLMGEVRINF